MKVVKVSQWSAVAAEWLQMKSAFSVWAFCEHKKIHSHSWRMLETFKKMTQCISLGEYLISSKCSECPTSRNDVIRRRRLLLPLPGCTFRECAQPARACPSTALHQWLRTPQLLSLSTQSALTPTPCWPAGTHLTRNHTHTKTSWKRSPRRTHWCSVPHTPGPCGLQTGGAWSCCAGAARLRSLPLFRLVCAALSLRSHPLKSAHYRALKYSWKAERACHRWRSRRC